jgi:hypothetical protein
MTGHRRTPRLALAGLVLASMAALVACTGTEAPEDPPRTRASDGAFESSDGRRTAGDADEDVPSKEEIPQKLHQGKIEPITAADIVIVAEGSLEISLQVIDPATGAAKTKIVTGPGIGGGAMAHPLVGATPDDPAVIAAEVWRPRGSRGAAEFTISTYSGTLLEPQELSMADDTRLHSGAGSSGVTDDGRYFVAWDVALFGVRVFDLEAGKETGELRLLGCGPFIWPVGRDIFSVCESSRELLHLAIQNDGSIVEVERAAVLPADFVSNRRSSFGFDGDKALLVGANGDVYVFDFARGMPADDVSPVGNAGRDVGRFNDAVINNPGTSLAVSYTDSASHPDSTDGGDTTTVVISDPSSLATIKTLTAESIGLFSFDGFGYSVDGATLYVQGESDDDEEDITLIGFDAASGAQTSRVIVPGFVGAAGRILTPRVVR